MEDGQLPIQAPLAPQPNRKLLWPVVGVVVVIAVVLAVLFMPGKKSAPKTDQAKTASSSGAASQLYEALGNAAKQQQLRVGMYRVTYANKADADAGQHVGTLSSSVSEIDATGGHYRSVFAYNFLQEDKTFEIGRCVNGTRYAQLFQSPAKNTARPTALQEAAGRLQLVPDGNLIKETPPPAISSPCPHLGLIMVSGATPQPAARLSDGVFPVTFTDQQAANWVTKLKAAALFDVTDEGTAQKDGRSLHKFSLTPKDQTKVNEKLYNIFYQAGEIDKIKRDHPKAEWQFEFLSINPLNNGSVGGFYLIDPATNLPVYSELYGTNPDKPTGKNISADKNIARTKQTYAYPTAQTVDLNTPLEILQ